MLTTSATILLLLLAVIFAITAKLAEYGKEIEKQEKKSAEAEERRIEKIRERGRFLREKKALSKKHSPKKK